MYVIVKKYDSLLEFSKGGEWIYSIKFGILAGKLAPQGLEFPHVKGRSLGLQDMGN